MKTVTIKSIGLGILVFFTGCSTYRSTYTNYDRGIDFSQYRTFAWAPDSLRDESKVPDEMAYDNDIVRNNAKNYITNNLTKRGMLVDIDSPDVVFQLVLLNEKKQRVVTYYTRPYMGYYYHSPFYFPYYYPYYRFYTWYAWSYPPFWEEETTYTKTYMKGTVTINMYDRKLKKLVWTGSAEGDIYDPAYIQFDVHPAIDRIMKQFPIKPINKPRRPAEANGRNPIVRTNNANGNFREGYSQ